MSFRDHLQKLFESITPPSEPVPAAASELTDYVRWGGVKLDVEQRLHYCVLGTSRSGKTTLLRILMQDALPKITSRKNFRGLIYDPKNEMHEILGSLGLQDYVVTLDPFSPHSSAWNIHEDLKDEESAGRIAEALFPSTDSKNDTDEFFRNSLQNLTKAVAIVFQRQKVQWTLRDLLLGLKSIHVTEEISRRYPSTWDSFNNTIQRLETSQDIISTTESFISRYRVIAALWHQASLERKGVSIGEWSRSNSILVLPSPIQSKDSISSLNQLIFNRASEAILAQPESDAFPKGEHPRIWVIIDELRTAGELLGLERLVSASASRGCRVVVGTQNIEGLVDAQGENKAEEILGLCHNRAFLRAPSPRTADWMSQQFKTRMTEIEERSISVNGATESTTFNYRKVDLALVRPEVFLNLDSPEWSDRLEGYFIAPGAKHPRYYATVTKERLFGGDDPIVRRFTKQVVKSSRPPEHQILQPWTLEDLHRLKLPPHLIAYSQPGQFPDFSSSNESSAYGS